ncbi:hypothetical protein [Microbacterium oleivorans]|uniref:hypothetical protein n=1 Tax=Microbacterium oleivorans TaxID=273677 RepID=UPI0011474900|nr:hypothetical protein [Microbacterium oleivorans]
MDSDEQFIVRVGLSLLSARRFYDDGHPEHARLALIVLDGAAELLLRRFVADKEFSFRVGQIMFRQNNEAAALGEDPPHDVHVMTFPSDVRGDRSFSPIYLSRRQQDRLDREFGPTVDVAVFFGALSPDEGTALKHLHEYRNGAHHRNVINLRTVRVLVELQLTVMASLLESMPSGPIYRLYPPVDWSEARELLGLDESGQVNYGAFADRLRAGIEQGASDVTSSFGGNLRERIEQVARRVEQIRNDMAMPGVTTEMWLGLAQTPEPWPVGEALHSLAPPVTTVTLDSWAEEVVRAEPDEAAFQTFARLAEIDHELTTLEDAIERVELQVDEAVQQLIDERRGK